MATTKNIFFDREKEIEKLNERYNELDSGGELVFLYGRRRLGKTRLIEEFLKQHEENSIYTSIVEGSKNQILKQISEDITNAGDFFESQEWDSLFRYLNKKSKNEKFIFVIDEFQRLNKRFQAIISRFQREWDSPLKNNKLMLILVGSSIGMMRKVALEDSSPLLGRPTWQFQLKPFSYLDFRKMFMEFSEEDKIKIYSIFGGTADYLSKLKKHISSYEKVNLLGIIKKLILEESGELYQQPENLLKSELKTSERYLQVLLSISSGAGKKSKEDILSKNKKRVIGLNYNSLGYYLKNLEIFLDLIKLEQPLFFKGKMGKYCISDNFFKFYFKFVYPYKETLKVGNYNFVLDNISENLDSYIGICYECIIRDILTGFNGRKFGDLNLNFIRIGSWWNRKTEEIDICAEGKNNVLLGEVKWNVNPLNQSVAKELIRKSKLVNTKKKKEFIIFSKNGFTEDCKKFMEKNKIKSFTLSNISHIISGKELQNQDWQNFLSPDKK